MPGAKLNVYAQLRAVQAELKAPKSEQGRFGKSRSAELVLEAAKPLCIEHGLTLFTTEEIIFVEGRHYVRQTAGVFNDEGDSIVAVGHAWEGEIERGLDSSQVTGKASSYAKKYALGNLLSIDDTKDADHPSSAPASAKPAIGSHSEPAAAKPNATRSSVQYASQAQLSMLMGAVKRASGLMERDDILAFFADEVGKQPNQVLATEVGALLKRFKGAGDE